MNADHRVRTFQASQPKPRRRQTLGDALEGCVQHGRFSDKNRLSPLIAANRGGAIGEGGRERAKSKLKHFRFFGLAVRARRPFLLDLHAGNPRQDEGHEAQGDQARNGNERLTVGCRSRCYLWPPIKSLRRAQPNMPTAPSKCRHTWTERRASCVPGCWDRQRGHPGRPPRQTEPARRRPR